MERKEIKKTEEEEDSEALRKLVSKKFWKWKKVFEKKESEQMLVQKAWNHAIKLKEGFVPKKKKVYLLLKKEREEI